MNGLALYYELKKKDGKVKISFLTAGEIDDENLVEEKYCQLEKDLFFQKPMTNTC
jgi:hypothetical protein